MVGEPVPCRGRRPQRRRRRSRPDPNNLRGPSRRNRPAQGPGPDAPTLHPGLNGNLVSERHFRYGDPEGAFATATHHISIETTPRNACTRIETYGVLAEYDPGSDAYDVLAKFQGPFSIHAVIALALKVPGNRLHLRTRQSPGGSFRREAGRVPLHRPDLRRRARREPSGEMGRGPNGAPRRLRLCHQPCHHPKTTIVVAGAGGRGLGRVDGFNQH